MNRNFMPDFIKAMIEKFDSGQSNQFILYGNINDIFPWERDEYRSLVKYLTELINPEDGKQPRMPIHYDLVRGVTFLGDSDREFVESVLDRKTKTLEGLMKNSREYPLGALTFLQELTKLDLKLAGTPKYGLGIIIEHAEFLFPRQETGFSNELERRKATIFREWFTDQTFIKGQSLVIMIAETMASINEDLLNLPFVSTIEIPRPDEKERRRYFRYLKQQHGLGLDIRERDAVFYTGGLTLLDIYQIFLQAQHANVKLNEKMIFARTKEVIAKELSGNLEFPIIDYDFSAVIGAKKLLAKLRELKECILSGNPELMPTGILVPGPNGVGKTFIFKAFARECGYLPVVIKNVRGQYVGQTESTWEKIRSVLEAMGNVMLIFDEADTEIGSRSSQTHDVDKRLFGAMMRMMSDKRNQGKIIWLIITARPDKLEPDIKRTGRAGEHIPVFDPEGDEREEFINFVLKKVGLPLDEFSEEERAEFLEKTEHFSPADFAQLLINLERKRYITKSGSSSFATSSGKQNQTNKKQDLTGEEALNVAKDFIPADISLQRELQSLLAFVECSYQSLIPEKYAHLAKQDALKQIGAIRALLKEA